MRYRRQEVRTAYHEAGHALIALHSIHLSSIGIERKIKRDSQTFTQKKGWLQPVQGAKVSLEENILIELAGPAAERLCPYGPGRDFYQASMADMQKVEKALKDLTASERGDYLHECRNRVEHMLKHHWPEVVALANALLERKRLSGQQAEKIAGEVWEKKKGG